MKSIITAVAAAIILAGTAFAQQRGADRIAAQRHATLQSQMDRAHGIVAQVNQAYGTHFLITEEAPSNVDAPAASAQTGRQSSPHTSWQFGPWLGRYPNGE